MEAQLTDEELAEVAFRVNVNRPIHWDLAAKLYNEVVAWRRLNVEGDAGQSAAVTLKPQQSTAEPPGETAQQSA